VKGILHQFNVPDKCRKLDPKTDNRTCDLLDLAGDIEKEKVKGDAEQENTQDESDRWPCYDNDEGWIDKWYD
jgi:hypothetical protein